MAVVDICWYVLVPNFAFSKIERYPNSGKTVWNLVFPLLKTCWFRNNLEPKETGKRVPELIISF